MPDGAVYVSCDRYMSPPARFVRKRRIVLTENAAHNAALFGGQVRCASGCTEARHQLNEDGRLAWKRVAQLAQPEGAKTRQGAAPSAAPVFHIPYEPPVEHDAPKRSAAPRLLAELTWLAKCNRPMPFLADLERFVASRGAVTPALQALHQAGCIQLTLSPHRPGFRREARVTVPSVGTIQTAGWVG